LLSRKGRDSCARASRAGPKASTRAHAPLAPWMGAVIKMVLTCGIHLCCEAGIRRGQPGRAGERLNRLQCADGVLIGMRTRREVLGVTAWLSRCLCLRRTSVQTAIRVRRQAGGARLV
jgi:hypothetical protein